MEDITRDLEREIEAGPSETDFSKRPRRWDILIVGDDGKVISVPWIRRLLMYILVLFVLVILLCLALFVMYQSAATEKQELRLSLKDAMDRNIALKGDIDRLTTRLVDMEKKKLAYASPPPPAAVQEKPVTEDPPHENPVKPPDHKALEQHNSEIEEASVQEDVDTERDVEEDVGDVEEDTPEILQPAETDDGETAETPYDVSMEDFEVTRVKYNNSLRIRFIIKNNSDVAQPVSGNIFMILKPDDLQEREWLPVPTVPLTSGMPTESKRGQYFSIRRYKTVRFIVTDQPDYTKYKKATIIVYSSEGALICEKDFLLNIDTN